MAESVRTILVVDDSPEDRELYRRYLLHDRKYSYKVLEASLGRQGLELWQQHRPDAVLLDYRLPDLDGLEFLSRLQSLRQQTDLPVIVITGQGSEAIAVQAMKAGAQDYLVKEQLSSESLRVALNSAITNVELRDRLHYSEEALRQSEERFRQITENTEAVFWIKEMPEHRVSYVSPAYQRLWQLNPQELYDNSQAWVGHIHSEDREAIETAFATKAAVGQFDQEYRIILADGSIRWVHDRCFPLQDAAGIVYRLTGIAEDITARKWVEESLRQSEAFRRRMLDSSSDCIKLLNLDSQILYINPGGLCLLEIDHASSYLNADWFCFWQADDRAAAEAAVAAAKAGEMSRFQGFCPTAKGTPKWWDVAVTPIFDSEGQVIQLLAISRDVTEQKQAEQERDRLLQLEQTARLEAERANRIKDEFLSVLSHELRSPLNPILGWTKLMQTRKFDPDRTAEALFTIERNAKLQCQLIDDLLDVAKILRGKLSMEAAPVDLAAVVEAAIETVKTAAAAKNIVLNPVLPQIGHVSGDAARLQQIVWNLLSNAIKFTPAGGRVEIQIAAVTEYSSEIVNQAEVDHNREPIKYVQLTVSDSGKGIDPSFLPYIFESFRQEDASTTRKYGGLGLGLAIVRHLVEAHGGTIRADSQGIGQGAVLTLRLPLLQTAPQSQTGELSQPELDLTGMRLLVADDEPDARELLTVLLTQYGAEVLAVTSAAEVLANLVQFQPDILISDIGMPEVDGYALIQQIRALPSEQGGRILAIALSAYAREEDRQQALSSGYQWHMTKPIDPEQLVEAIMLTRSPHQQAHTILGI
jgi:PAS domain S-box-containing protein